MENEFSVVTGFGYFEDAGGNIIAKASLPKGQHDKRPGYSYHEVADQAALDEVEVWSDPEITKERADQAKIASKVEAMAIAELKKDDVALESQRYKVK